MPIQPFKLERYFARYEFRVKYLLSSSDCEALTLSELLAMSSPDSLQLWNNLKLSYTESAGHPLLRQVISSGYTQIKPDDILVAAPEEAIFLLMQTFIRPGDQVIAIAPAYQSLHELANSLGAEILPWTLEASAGGWQLNLDWLSDHLSSATRLLILNFPNNPTGFLPTLDQFEEILSLAARHKVTVFCDVMYRLLENDPTRRLPAVCDTYEYGTSLSGLSKSYALPGLRVGWLATRQKEVLAACQSYKDYTTICQSAPSEILAIIALQNTPKIITRNLSIIQANLDLARQFFSRHAGLLEWIEPHAGSIAFPHWLGPGTVDEFCQAVLQQQGVMLVPGSLFDHTGSHFRLGLGRTTFADGLEHLDEFLTTGKGAQIFRV